jgi:hypothetical protein
MGNSVTIIDGVTNAVINTITVGSSPNAFCRNATQNRTYVANYASSNLSVLRDSMTSGIEEECLTPNVTLTELEIYPNPAKSVIRVRCPSPIAKIKIFDVTGKTVKEMNSFGVNEVAVSLKGINSGIYFVQLDNQTTIKKLMVTK